MLSKFARVACSLRPGLQAQALPSGRALSTLMRRPVPMPALPRGLRARSDLVPPNQYDRPKPNTLKFLHTISTFWETIPLVICTAVALGLLASSIIWACFNKIDVVFSTYSRKNLSRTMDLCNPTVHKVIIINQRYETWPEMQCVLDKMVEAEKRQLMRSTACPFAT